MKSPKGGACIIYTAKKTGRANAVSFRVLLKWLCFMLESTEPTSTFQVSQNQDHTPKKTLLCLLPKNGTFRLGDQIDHIMLVKIKRQIVSKSCQMAEFIHSIR